MKISKSEKPLLAVTNLKVGILSKRGLVKAVDGVSFSLNKGSRLGLVGESGCGKSILALSILGLLPKEALVSKESKIQFDGLELTRIPEKQIRQIRGQRISMVFQDPMTSLNPVLTIGQQLKETLRILLKMKPKTAKEKSIELLKSVGISIPEKRIKQYPYELSGGLRQRVAIAIALACDPEILIADEPTTALDVTIQAEILELLAKLQQEQQMAMILISHNLGVVSAHTDFTGVMYAGRIIEMAPTSDLFGSIQMPYTKALMDAVPRLSNLPHSALTAIEGQPPDLVNLPSGCRFSPRCVQAENQCFVTEPALTFDENGLHQTACWYPLNMTQSR